MRPMRPMRLIRVIRVMRPTTAKPAPQVMVM